MKKIAVIGAVLDYPAKAQQAFNDILSEHHHMIKGRMGIPFNEHDISVVAITVCASIDDINTLTGKLGRIEGVTIKTSITKKELGDARNQ